MVERLLEKRLRRIVTVDEMQFGSMPERGTIDIVFILRSLQEEYYAKGKKLYMCVVDLEKAFDRVPWKVLERALRKKQIPEVLTRSVNSLYERDKTRIRVDSELSVECEIKVGMHLGSVMSPFLSASVVDAVTEIALEGALVELLFADDLVLISETSEGLGDRF